MREFEFEGEDNYFEAMDYMARVMHEENVNATPSRSAVQPEDLGCCVPGPFGVGNNLPDVLRPRVAS